MVCGSKLILEKCVLRTVLTLLCFLSLCACGGENRGQRVCIYFKTGVALNVDPVGKASPLDVRIYQLDSVQDFEEANFFTLYNAPEKVLKNHLLSKNRLEIRANENLLFEMFLLPKTEYVGFVCAYRNIEKTKWKEVIKVSDFSWGRISVDLKESGVEILNS